MKDFFTWDEIMRDLAIVVVVLIVIYVSNNITPVNIDTVSSGSFFTDLLAFLQGKTTSFAPVQESLLGLESLLGVLALVFFAATIWVSLRAREIHHKIHDQYAPLPVDEVEAKGFMIEWQVILNHVESENPAEWKIAILEADNMLDGILDDQGYLGETVADKLKAMSPSRVVSYDDVWEAHKVRNQIAHGGAIDMELSKKMARDTIAKFGNAFKDLGYL